MAIYRVSIAAQDGNKEVGLALPQFIAGFRPVIGGGARVLEFFGGNGAGINETKDISPSSSKKMLSSLVSVSLKGLALGHVDWRYDVIACASGN